MDDAETMPTAAASVSASKLQWGRVMDDAETSRFLADVGAGARLQWGRVMDDAETPECVIEPTTSVDASMGPRHG